ncbi:uncharacterized protein B4U80_08599, partial [Leptotrombidium deliense]
LAIFALITFSLCLYKFVDSLTDKTKIGICSVKAENIGFVFGDYFSPLQQIRSQIQEIFDENKNKQSKITFKFVDKNGWPITNNQETLLTVSDVLINQQINIKYKTEVEEAINKVNIEYSLCHKQPVAKTDSLTKDNSEDVNDAGISSVNRWRRAVASKKSIKRMGTRKVGLRFKSIKLTKAHPVMISYARQEAAQHALNLKTELVKLGFSVYLDVHEIRTGTDWQDNLNSAVSNCLVFIPLVTPVYGKTQWTNREIKLADILHKKIIPINFLETWPPECLAIQFATTQYIPWRPAECESEIKWDSTTSQTDISVWPPNCLKRVSKLIAEQIPSKVPREKLTRTVSDKSTSIDGKPLIVISGHPQQRKISLEVKMTLEEEGFNVWCSNESLEIDDSDGLTTTDQKSKIELQKPLSTICEEDQDNHDIVFNENIKKITSNFSENQTHSLEIPKICHPPLTKTMSTLSNFSQLSMSSQKLAYLKEFQEKVSNAAVVVVLASQAYYTSRTSRQHVYYCEHRKKVIVVQCDQSAPSSWFSMLLRNEMPLVSSDPKFYETLKRQIRRILNPLTKTLNNNLNESKIQVLVTFLSKNLPVLGSCVYVVGSVHTRNTRTLDICNQIAVEMAKVKNITLVTGGCSGASATIAERFFEIKSKERRPSLSKTVAKNAIMRSDSTETNLVHVLPSKDTEEVGDNDKYKQNEEGNFESMNFGETLFVGESIKERDLVISRLLDTCILIEGDAEDSKVAQEFLWNDHYVIPIVSTSGAACGTFGLPSKTFECPIGVENEDWNILSSPTATAEEVGKAVVRIVVQIKKSIVYHALSKLGSKGKPMLRQNLRQSKRRRKGTLKQKKASNGVQNNSDRSKFSEKVLPIIDLEQQKHRHFKPWASVVQFFSFPKK